MARQAAAMSHGDSWRGEWVARLCAIARDKVIKLLRELRSARQERDKLRADYGDQPGFADI